jgi:hypothetical protein
MPPALLEVHNFKGKRLREDSDEDEYQLVKVLKTNAVETLMFFKQQREWVSLQFHS